MSALQRTTRLGVGHYRVVDSMSPRTVTVTRRRREGACGVVQSWLAQPDWDGDLVSRPCATRAEAVGLAEEMIENARWAKCPGGRP